MIEYTITEALAIACSLTLNEDIWACALPKDREEGVCVTVLRDIDTRLDQVGKARLAIYVVKISYFDCRTLASSIADRLNKQIALDGWMAEDVSVSYKGINITNHHMITVYANIRKE